MSKFIVTIEGDDPRINSALETVIQDMVAALESSNISVSGVNLELEQPADHADVAAPAIAVEAAAEEKGQDAAPQPAEEAARPDVGTETVAHAPAESTPAE